MVKMPTFSMVIPIVPTPQRRARATVIGGHARMYTDSKQRRDEQNIRSYLYGHLPEGAPFQGPIRLTFTAWMPIPSSYSTKKALMAEQGIIQHTVRPDLDNLAKCLKDSLTGVLWVDDRQIVSLQAEKRYGQLPGWSIVVEWDEP